MRPSSLSSSVHVLAMPTYHDKRQERRPLPRMATHKSMNRTHMRTLGWLERQMDPAERGIPHVRTGRRCSALKLAETATSSSRAPRGTTSSLG